MSYNISDVHRNRKRFERNGVRVGGKAYRTQSDRWTVYEHELLEPIRDAWIRARRFGQFFERVLWGKESREQVVMERVCFIVVMLILVGFAVNILRPHGG